MAIGVQVWSQTASANSTADTNINWAEGMAPSQVNDSARAEMASVAKFRDDNNGTLATSGTTAAYTLVTNQVEGALTEGYTVAVKFHATNDNAATLAVDSLAAKNLQVIAGTNVSSGVFLANSIHRFKYDSGSTAWIAQGGNLIDAAGIASLQIADNAVTYQKIQTPRASVLLGNPSTSTSTGYKEVTLGTGLLFSGTALTAPQFPPTASFKNLVIKVTGNSTANASADFVTVATSGSSAFQTLAFASQGLDFANTGSVNQLDAGSLAGNNTFYAIYAIATAVGTSVGYLASTSFTSPTMPSGFTYKARIGSVVTATSTSSPVLMGTFQFGRRAQYVVGLAGTAQTPIVGSGTAGTYSVTSPALATLSTTNFVPPTASTIKLALVSNWKGNAASNILVAPSTGWGGPNNGPTGSNGNVYAFNNQGTSNISWSGELELEATSIAWASSQSGGAVSCLGWEDNI